MKTFKLPRKLKKYLRRGLWLYPADEKGNSLMASPARYEKDYLAYKCGELRNLTHRNKAESKEYWKKLNTEIEVSDTNLKKYVDDIFAEEYRRSSFDTLIKAKKNKHTIKAYYNFINAYHQYESEEFSSGNTCCLAVDYAKQLLRKK